jgi:hypothetical protein
MNTALIVQQESTTPQPKKKNSPVAKVDTAQTTTRK